MPLLSHPHKAKLPSSQRSQPAHPPCAGTPSLPPLPQPAVLAVEAADQIKLLLEGLRPEVAQRARGPQVCGVGVLRVRGC